MKKSLTGILCCTMCKGDIELMVEEEINNDIRKGKLYCPQCKIYYHIEDGIPNMLPPNYKY